MDQQGPTLREVMHRLDTVVSTVSDLVQQVRENQQDAASTYVRRDVHHESRRADQAEVRELRADVEQLRQENQRHVDFRKQVALGAALGALTIAGSFGLALFNLLVGG